jgi:hypothetical protein
MLNVNDYLLIDVFKKNLLDFNLIYLLLFFEKLN